MRRVYVKRVRRGRVERLHTEAFFVTNNFSTNFTDMWFDIASHRVHDDCVVFANMFVSTDILLVQFGIDLLEFNEARRGVVIHK